MDKEITQRIKQYLEIETNYAIIINGDYGIGKTYYIKNTLFSEVKNIEIPNGLTKEKYMPVLVSLFGAKSMESIQEKIFFELYPILKKKSVNFLTGIGSHLLKYFTDSDLKELLSDIGADSESFTNYSKIVLFIDDIDRISRDLSLRDVFGFINNLVENLNSKVLIIANEDELRKQYNNTEDNGKDAYSILREKVIGITIQFNSNIESLYDEIINKFYKKQDNNYYKFLNSNRKYIIEQICINRHNLRNLLFFIEHFKIVYNSLVDFFKEYDEYEKLKKEIEFSLLRFSLPLSIEYKLGMINTSNFQELENFFTNYYFKSVIFSEKFNSKLNDKQKDKTYIQLFHEKYFKGIRMNIIYYDSVFNYIIGKRSFNSESFIDDIKYNYKIEEQLIPIRESILKKLQYWDCINLTTKEYISLTRELLTYVDKGEFNLDQYATVFHFCIRFNNPLRLNINNLVKRFKRGIYKGKSHYKYQNNLKIFLSDESSPELYDRVKEIIFFCNDINKEILNEENSNKINKLFHQFKIDFTEFIENIEYPEYKLFPIFAEIQFKETWRIIKVMKNSDIIQLAFFFENRYKPDIYEKLFPEKVFLIELQSKLEKQITNTKTNKMRRIAFDHLLNTLKNSFINFPK